MKCPNNELVISHVAYDDAPGAISPNCVAIVESSAIAFSPPLSEDDTIAKSTNNPFSFSTIFGCFVNIRMFVALPLPLLRSITLNSAGTTGSTTSFVNGLSP